MPVNLSTPGVYDGSEPEAEPPVHQTTPGVYVNQTDSFPLSIVGVSTTITAFVGLAMWGPTADDPQSPVAISNFDYFETHFGGLWRESTMSYAVQQFFLNGGSEALIVRLPNGAAPAQFTIPLEDGGAIVVEAVTPGTWGNRLRVMIDHVDTPAPLFNMSVYLLDESLTTIVDSMQYQGVSLRSEFLHTLKEGRNHQLFLRYKGNPPSTTSRPTATSDTGTFDLKSLIAPAVQGVDGHTLKATDYLPANGYDQKTGIYAFRKAFGFNLLCIPPYARDTDVEKEVWEAAATFCLESDAILLIDAPRAWDSTDFDLDGIKSVDTSMLPDTAQENVVVYFPRVRAPDPLDPSGEAEFVPCGAVAGLITTTDTIRGVWAAPAGVTTALNGVHGLTFAVDWNVLSIMNALGINCLRYVPPMAVCIWGERTLAYSNRLTTESTLIPVRRLTLYIKASIATALLQVKDKPNDETLWVSLRALVGTFMSGLYAQGALDGATPQDAYSVKCGPDTTASPQNDIVMLEVEFMPHGSSDSVSLNFQQQQTG